MSRTKEYLENLHNRYVDSDWFYAWVQELETQEKEYYLTQNFKDE